ncbi:MAG: hypothetical protein JHC26_11575 [Thermofilum sp.]|uniref:hypothetical protein n=1 Tax=Thermofilum sp. TaxID=1961369 RepID=UPI00258729E9|nr:hypothetical protein [Thermofilum sp.]MCI4409722.1 hypothetical protein [Thermofilum sp.]
MGKLSPLKDAVEFLLILVLVASFLFLPTIITYTLYWGRINDNIMYTNMMVQLLWFMIIAMMNRDDEDDK